MVVAQNSVRRAEGNAARAAVGREQTVKGTAGPVQGKRVLDQWHLGRLIHHEPAIRQHRLHEPGAADLGLPDLGQELDLEEGDGGDPPGTWPWSVSGLR